MTLKKKDSEKTSKDQKQLKTKETKHTVTEYVRQGSIGAGLQECSLTMTKQSEVAIAYLIGHDPG